MSLNERILGRTIVGYGLALLLGEIVIHTGLRSWWPIELLNNFGAWFYLPIVGLIVGLLMGLRKGKAKQWLIGLVIPMLLFGWNYAWVLTPNWAGNGQGEGLRVMTWNVRYDNPADAGMIRAIMANQPDVVVFQELVNAIATTLSQSPEIQQRFPYQRFISGSEFGILSRYPIEALPMPIVPNCQFEEIKVTLPQQAISLVNVHLPTPIYQVRRLLSIPLPVGFNSHKQAQCYDRFLPYIDQISRPLLVLGDFNTSDRHWHYQGMHRRLADSFKEAGWGFGFTYPGRAWSVPLVRIDYIFHSAQWGGRSAWTGKGAGSDHQFLVADLRVRS
jgi:vancomycin resistance protein VanJ